MDSHKLLKIPTVIALIPDWFKFQILRKQKPKCKKIFNLNFSLKSISKEISG